jgi:hypothetical protein
MKTSEALPALNELLHLLCRSLPAYLAEAAPWAHCRHEPVQTALDRLTADERRYALRVADAITARGGRPNPGRFPPLFAAKNDLSLEYLLREVVDSQQQDIAALKRCAQQLERESALHALAEEILGNAEGHLDILREMTKE